VEVEPSGKLLVVENGAGRLDRIDPKTGKRSVVASIARPYAVARSSAGAVFVSAADGIWRVGAGAPQRVAEASDVGPIAVGRSGDVFYLAGASLYRMGADAAVANGVDGAHGLAVTSSGALLVSDTDRNRVVRVDPASGVLSVVARVGGPRGLAVAADGSIFVVDSRARRVLHLSATGRRLGWFGPALTDPYDLAVRGSAIYVLDTAAAGTVKRLTATGKPATVPHG
jgi:sugar lactone lactonase YvrE